MCPRRLTPLVPHPFLLCHSKVEKKKVTAWHSSHVANANQVNEPPVALLIPHICCQSITMGVVGSFSTPSLTLSWTCRSRRNAQPIKADTPLSDIYFQQQRNTHFADQEVEPIGIFPPVQIIRAFHKSGTCCTPFFDVHSRDPVVILCLSPELTAACHLQRSKMHEWHEPGMR